MIVEGYVTNVVDLPPSPSGTPIYAVTSVRLLYRWNGASWINTGSKYNFLVGPQGATTYVGNIDGGSPNTSYGGTNPIDGGTP